MTEERCTMAPLVEARRDGRLDAREVASVERHLAACAACRALAADLDRLAEVARLPATAPPTPLEHQRGRVALLRAAAGAEPANDTAAVRRLKVVLAAAAALAVTGALSAGAIAWSGHRALDAVAVARRLPPPPALAARLDTTVRGAPGARFERARVAEVERVALADGAIDLEVRPLAAGERFLVATDDAEVEVRGTVFHVEAREGHLIYVSVREGKVEVRRGTESALLTPGQEWRDERPRVEVEPAPAPLPKQARATVVAHSVAARDKPPPAAPSSNGLAEGVRLVERGDYAAAAERLEAFHADHPGDARGEDAAFLTVIALQRAGRKDEARAAAHRYLAQYPKGYRRAEAEAIAAGQP
jgi:FecR protein/Putative zinc-finger/Outer membrane lipoprotein